MRIRGSDRVSQPFGERQTATEVNARDIGTLGDRRPQAHRGEHQREEEVEVFGAADDDVGQLLEQVVEGIASRSAAETFGQERGHAVRTDNRWVDVSRWLSGPECR
jgi:hypothetical protein